VNESAGQLADAPVQFSATSQTPATERQTVAPLAKQLSGPSLHVLPQIPPPMHGSPAWLLHVPPAQVSGPLQNRPSLHGAVLLLCTQVPAPLHSSSVQTLPSVVHADPRSSLQVSAASLHESWQTLPPVHGSPECWLQVPPPQMSVPLQNRPSSQTLPSPPSHALVASLQAPAQVPMPPAHGSPGWTVHDPARHVSGPLQNVPSSHGPVLFVCAQVPVPLQKSSVQTLPSVEHGVELLALPSAGHVAEPLQTSAASHSSVAARHVIAPANPSAGHEADAPLQVSATSQTPFAARQVLPDENESAGQVVEAPVQFSATSQTPAEERQTVAALAKQSSVDSLHVLPQIPPPVHGSPACDEHVPPLQVSAPLQNCPSSHEAALLG